MKKSYSLNSENKEISILVNPENPYIKIFIRSFGLVNEKNQNSQNLVLTFFKKKDSKKDEQLIPIDSIVWPVEYYDSSINEITLKLDETASNITTINLEVQQGKDLIDVSDPVVDFQEHLSNPSNPRILFSAPFGQGKTTFLDVFFTVKEDEYDVFKVFPVNYSVANNEDIFRYIKTDILFQLLERDIEWDKTEINQSQAISEYLFLNPKTVTVNFFKMLLSLDKRTQSIGNILNGLESILNDINTYKQEQENDDQQSALLYVKELYEKEGSLFEDNFYTQLIRQLLERLKETSHNVKENVLIIEDLDRMDPDHIFRILNVISAHYDTYHNTTYAETSNKFGFDKIIVVCDQQNIKSIFHHKYGLETDFNGYFNKYFSSKPFLFNNKENVKSHLRDYYFNDQKNEKRDPFSKALNLILEALFLSDIVSHREVSKITREDFQRFKSPENVDGIDEAYHFRDGLFYKSLSFLNFTMGQTRLEEALKKLIVVDFNTKRQFDYYTRCLIPMLFNSNNGQFFYQGNEYTYSLKGDFNFDFYQIEFTFGNRPIFELNHTDFYKYLFQVFEKYKLLFVK
jgi:KAP family P-loop domain